MRRANTVAFVLKIMTFENAFACNEISQSGLDEDALLSRESGGKRNSVPFPLLLVCIGKQVPRYVVVHVSRGKQ